MSKLEKELLAKKVQNIVWNQGFWNFISKNRTKLLIIWFDLSRFKQILSRCAQVKIKGMKISDVLSKNAIQLFGDVLVIVLYIIRLLDSHGIHSTDELSVFNFHSVKPFDHPRDRTLSNRKIVCYFLDYGSLNVEIFWTIVF